VTLEIPPAAPELAEEAGEEQRLTPTVVGRSRRVSMIFAQVALISWAVISALPLLWAVMSSFKTDSALFSHPWLPSLDIQLSNFSKAWSRAHLGRYFLNTIIVVGFGVTLTILFSSMAAYVISRFEFRGKRVVYYLFTAGLAFPVFLALVPLYGIMQSLGLLNSYVGLIIVYVAYSLPFSVFFLTAFFETLPRSIAEAALIDGASHFGVFFRVMVPMARPGLISVGTFNFVGQWNQFLLPLVLITDPNKFLLSQGIANLAVSQNYNSSYTVLFAALVLTMIPLVIVYVLFQRWVQEGMTAGALK
jgi:N-acetylglucosamine transport system permease protein